MCQNMIKKDKKQNKRSSINYDKLFEVNKENKTYLDDYFSDTSFAKATKDKLENDVLLNNDLDSLKGLKSLDNN